MAKDSKTTLNDVNVAFGDTVTENKEAVVKETKEAVHAYANFLKEAWDAIKALFKSIGAFFKKLFTKKDKKENQ